MRDSWIRAGWQGSARAITTTRQGGVSTGPYAGLNLADHVGDRSEAVARNRELLMRAIGVERIQWLDQVHGTRCVRADVHTVAQAPEADAAWTDEQGVAVAVLTADCLPVAIRGHHIVAVAHAGWRGLVGGVLPSLLRELPGDPGEYRAWIGPGIGVDAYEVGGEVAAAVRGITGLGDAMEACLRPSSARPGKYQLDLAALAALQLRGLGLGEVACEHLCTFADPRLYSYRRDGTTGRMATVVWRE